MRKGLIAVAFLFLVGACTSTDIREEHLIACTAYTSVLEQVADNKDLGLYTQSQVDDIRRIELQTTPLCAGPATTSSYTLILQALRQLNTYLLLQEN